MFKIKTIGVGFCLAVVITVGSAILWQAFKPPRQSSVRLMHKIKLKQLRYAIDIYKEIYKKPPADLEDLAFAGIISDILYYDSFQYTGGLGGIFAFQKKPFRKVSKGEIWGRSGEVAKYDIAKARLVLLANGAIELIGEADFKKKYGFLTAELPGISGSIEKFNAPIEDLAPGIFWSKWYQNESGYVPDPKWFGAYVTLPVENEIYIGMGTGRPTLGDGALVARFDGKKLETIGALTEEGIHEMIWDSHTGTLHVAGTDPSWPDDWSAGNHYTYIKSVAKKIVKHRDPENGLINVIHTWGLWFSENHELFAAVNTHDGSFRRDRNILRRIFYRINAMFDSSYYSTDYGVTRLGQVFKSRDNGSTWSHVADLGYFRAYDFIGFNNRLYAIYADKPELPCKLAVSEDNAESWRDVTQNWIQRVHLTRFQDKLITVSHAGESIYALSSDHLKRYDLPKGFKVASNFNVLAAGENFFYALCSEENGNFAILRTPDLHKWQQVGYIDKKLISLSYWKAKKWLVVSGMGTHANIWKIDLLKFQG
jgi:hypothetical protein